MKIKPLRKPVPQMSEPAVEAAPPVALPPPIAPEVDDLTADAKSASTWSTGDAHLRPAPRLPREPKPMTDLRNEDAKTVTEWLRELSPTGAVKVSVTRLDPKSWRGANTGGNVGTYEEMIDEDFVRDHHGGGLYQLTVRTPHPSRAGWVFTPGGTRQIRIAGDPRTDDVFRDKGAEVAASATPSPATGIVDRALGSLERQLEREQAKTNHGPDTDTIRLMMAPMQQQLDQMARMLSEKDRQLLAAQQPKPEVRDEFRDKMLDKLLDGDSARITALRTQYESELRMVKQSANDNEARLRDGFDRDKQALAMAHDRELKALAGSHTMTLAAQAQSAATSQTLLEGEIRRLVADLSEAKAELAALRAKKDKTIVEQAAEFAQIQEAIGGITGAGDAKEKSTFEKVLETASNLPAVQNALSKLASGEAPSAAPAQPAPQQPRPARLLAGEDGNLYRQLPTGELQMVRRRATPPPGTPAPPPQIPAATIKLAVDFLEAAFRNGQDPAGVATSVRSMIPADVITAIRDLGIDDFLANVAKLDATSPLQSQAGRNWSRKLGKVLVEG